MCARTRACVGLLASPRTLEVGVIGSSPLRVSNKHSWFFVKGDVPRYPEDRREQMLWD